MKVNKIYQGDALSVLQTFPDNSIDMCMTSPPYWGLRDYGVEQIFGGDKDCEHEWIDKAIRFNVIGGGINAKQKTNRGKLKESYIANTCQLCGAWKGQLGLESTPEMYIKHMTEIFHEIKRVLKKEGTLWIVIGDTYTNKSIPAGNDPTIGKRNIGESKYSPTIVDGLPSKCLCMIPERLAWAMIQDGWILRNKNIWYKHNGMPSSVRDRFSNKYEIVYMFSQTKKYYFDLDAVREPHVTQENRPDGIVRNREWGYNSKENKLRERKWSDIPGQQKQSIEKHSGYYRDGKCLVDFKAGKNPGDVFEINTQPYPEAHFAVYPVKLCEKPIKAGCPKEVCVKCGKARERVIKRKVEFTSGSGRSGNPPKGKHENEIQSKSGSYDIRMGPVVTNKTIGWTSCDCNAGFKPGIVIDPFSGAGTTCYTAIKLGCDFIGIEINGKYKLMSEERIFGSLFKPIV